ncbi:MAG: DUF2191 domain-containing protein [Terriglobia bacterium]
MRTTIDIDEPVFRELKQEAVRRKTTLREVVNACLRRGLTAATRPGKYVFRWKTHRGRIQPGVRLDDRDSLFDLMDGR